MPNMLTDTEFSNVQDKIDMLCRTARRGTPEQQALYAAVNAEWEAAIAMPQRTYDQRKVRDAAIAAVAVKHGLVPA